MPFLFFVLSLVLSLTLVPANESTIDYSGAWEYRIELEMGLWSGAIVLEKQSESYTGYVITKTNFEGEEGLRSEITDLVLEGSNLTFKTIVFGYEVFVSGEFDDEVYRAKFDMEGMTREFVAKRKL